MRKRILAFVILLLFTPACTHEIEVISIPPGARIEVDHDYVGDAPLTIKVRTDYWPRVRAVPTRGGHVVQSKLLRWPMPKRVLFDTRLGPVPVRAEVDIKLEKP